MYAESEMVPLTRECVRNSERVDSVRGSVREGEFHEYIGGLVIMRAMRLWCLIRWKKCSTRCRCLWWMRLVVRAYAGMLAGLEFHDALGSWGAAAVLLSQL